MKTEHKTLIRALRGEILETPPIWLMRQAGRYLPEYRETRKIAKNFLEFCYTPDLAVEATLQPIRRYDFDASIMFCDILVIPDALGQDVSFREGEGPVLDPIRSVEALRDLNLDGVLDHLAPVFEVIRRLKVELPEDKTLIGFAGSPWTVALYMIEGRGGTDGETARRWAYQEPETFSEIIDLLVEATIRYLNAQIENGAEVIQLFDSWSGLLAEEPFRRWVIEPTRRIVEGVRAKNVDTPIIGFPRGSGLMAPEFIHETGVTGISLDANIPLEWARENLQSLVTVQGNLDNQLLVAGGPALDEAVLRIKKILGMGPFIFNLGHGIVPATPPENVARVVDLVRQS
ncbi:MAG: uroporphyrinogen decarboxylase [Rhodospirillaceae bacterium]|nr:uroporphyrinogen decarboxylase [Rhodospirillaceae bacterium]